MKVTEIGKTSELAKVFLQKLEQSNAQSLQNSEFEVSMMNFSESISVDDHRTLKEMIDKDKSILFLENVKKEHFPDNSLITVDSDLCIIKSESNGRRQHILILGTKEQPKLELASRKNEEDTIEVNEEVQKKKTPEQEFKKEASTDTVKVRSKIDAQNILDWLVALPLQTHEDIQLVNASLIRGSVTIESLHYTSDMNGKPTNASTYSSYNVELAAVVEPKRNKVLKITSVASHVSITDGLSKNSEDDKGDGTYEGRMIFYPGNKYTFEKSEIKLPHGWRIIKIAPETLNHDNNYARTTGWTIGAEGGGAMSKDPNVAAKLSASYSESEAYSQSFKDFSALNKSNSAYCDWEYLYTKVYRDWKSIFSSWMKDIENFPDLAKSTMYMKNEVVYEAPASDNSCQRFCTYIHHQTLYAHSHSSWGVIHYGIKYKTSAFDWNYFDLNMNSVIFPKNS